MVFSPTPGSAYADAPLPAIVVNHLLEPPERVTGITRFLFALLPHLIEQTEGNIVLLTCWPEASLPAALLASRLMVRSYPFHKSTTVNVLRQRPILAQAMNRPGGAIEFNANPIGTSSGDWPRVITVHDLYLDLMPDEYPTRHRLAWKLMMPRSLKRAAGIVVPSSSTRADLVRFYPNHSAGKIFVLPEAPAFDQQAPVGPAPLTGRYGLMVGNVSPNKNAPVVVQALTQLAARGIHVPLLHIGRDEGGHLARALSSAKIDVPIISRAGVPDEILRAAYKHATFFLNTSLHEGFCLPVVEAQAMGTPVIASNRSALPEVAGQGALFIDPESAIDVAAAIERIWTDANYAAELTARGTVNVSRYAWSATARQLTQILQAVAAVRQPVSLASKLPTLRQPDRT
jgi:glycosyltransferase involved in cell wall biosynthesis